MIVIGGSIRFDPANFDHAVDVAQEMMTATHKEAGCVQYNFSLDLANKGLLWIFEEWESEEALTKHFNTPHMAAFMKAMPTIGVQSIDVHRYTATEKEPVQPPEA